MYLRSLEGIWYQSCTDDMPGIWYRKQQKGGGSTRMMDRQIDVVSWRLHARYQSLQLSLYPELHFIRHAASLPIDKICAYVEKAWEKKYQV